MQNIFLQQVVSDMHYVRNYRETKQNYKIVGSLFIIGSVIALPLFGIEALGFTLIGVIFLLACLTTKCIHWRLYDSCKYCQQLFCTDCRQNFGHLSSYTDMHGIVKPEYEDIIGYDQNKIISGQDNPQGYGSICTMCLDIHKKRYGNKRNIIDKILD